MAHRGRFLSVVGGARIIAALGALLVALGVGWAVLATATGKPLAEALIDVVLIGAPGVALLYGGYWLSRSGLHPDVHPRVAAWCLGGMGVMLGVVALLVLNPGGQVDRPVRAALIATALGGIGGLVIGINNARALSRARELEETVEELEIANQRLEQFAYAASHDLQEPLRMVSSYLQLLERRYKADLDADAREFIGFAVDGADRMRAMIESLLEYSRVTTGGQPLEPSDAEAVLDDVLADLQLRIEETDATVTADELPTVTADPDQLAQVFRNLLLNAFKYSGDEPPRVHVGSERTADGWRFSVADEGIGIDPEYHDRIFKVFEQLHAADDAAEIGAGGIGLPLCARIIERHGGDIWVESEPGEGATFYFTIPAAAEAPDHERPGALRV